MTLRTLLARTALLGSVGLAVLAATAYLPPPPPPGLCVWNPTRQRCVLTGQCLHPDEEMCTTPPGSPGSTDCACRKRSELPGGGS